jgi:SLT domain-containing protein
MTSRIEEANKQAKALNSEFEKTAQTVSDGIKKPLEDLKDIGKQITNVLDMGIKGFSKGIAESIVLGKELKATFKSIGQTLAVTILQTLIEIIARETVLLAIEKAKLTYKTISASLSGGQSFGSIFHARASGGSVQKGQPYMVGERGAELFIPNQSGQITQSARGTGGGATTVNFNINTLDASGFEDLLVRSRGTITSIINNAVNERGERSII